MEIGGAGSGGVLTPAAVQNAPQINDSTVRYRFIFSPHVGDVYTYRVTQKSTTEIDTLKGSDEKTYNFTHRITGVNADGSVTLEMVYNRITFRATTPPNPLSPKAQTFSYSTDQKADSIPGAQEIKALIGHKVNMTLAPNGEVMEISNVDPILSAILGDKKGQVPAEKLEQARMAIKVISYQAIVQQLFLKSSPDSGSRVGGSWTRSDDLPLTLPLASVPAKSKVEYRLAEVRNVNNQPVAIIKVSLAVSFPKKNVDNELAAAVIEQAQASGSGEAQVNLRSGYPLRKTTRVDATLKLKVTAKAKAGPEAAGKTQSIRQRLITSTTVELVDYKPAP